MILRLFSMQLFCRVLYVRGQDIHTFQFKVQQTSTVSRPFQCRCSSGVLGLEKSLLQSGNTSAAFHRVQQGLKPSTRCGLFSSPSDAQSLWKEVAWGEGPQQTGINLSWLWLAGTAFWASSSVGWPGKKLYDVNLGVVPERQKHGDQEWSLGWLCFTCKLSCYCRDSCDGVGRVVTHW